MQRTDTSVCPSDLVWRISFFGFSLNLMFEFFTCFQAYIRTSLVGSVTPCDSEDVPVVVLLVKLVQGRPHCTVCRSGTSERRHRDAVWQLDVVVTQWQWLVGHRSGLQWNSNDVLEEHYCKWLIMQNLHSFNCVPGTCVLPNVFNAERFFRY